METGTGFFMLKSRYSSEYEALITASNFAAEFDTHFFVRTDEKKGGKFIFFLLNSSFKEFKKGDLYFVRATIRPEGKRPYWVNLGPISKETMEEFIIPFKEYCDQINKKRLLESEILFFINQEKDIVNTMLELRQSRFNKIQEVRNQDYEKASRCRDEERKILSKIHDMVTPLTKEISKRKKFEWVTSDHIVEIINDRSNPS